MTSDFILLTDGSGHEDGFGGWAALAWHVNSQTVHTIMGCESGTSTDRMEWTGLLNGMELCRKLSETKYQGTIVGRVKVLWYNDRESIVKFVQHVHGYSSSKDLVQRYVALSDKVEVTAQHTKIDDRHPAFQYVDLHASSLRISIKDYVQSVSDFQGSLFKPVS